MYTRTLNEKMMHCIVYVYTKCHGSVPAHLPRIHAYVKRLEMLINILSTFVILDSTRIAFYSAEHKSSYTKSRDILRDLLVQMVRGRRSFEKAASKTITSFLGLANEALSLPSFATFTFI